MKDEKSYELHAAWEEGHCIGRLIISHDRRGQMIAFEYEEDWLEKHPGFMLDLSVKFYSVGEFFQKQ